MSFYFENTMDAFFERSRVEAEYRKLDKYGVYVPIERYRAMPPVEYDMMGELANSTHVTNILIEPGMLDLVLTEYSYIHPTHIRLGSEYRVCFQ